MKKLSLLFFTVILLVNTGCKKENKNDNENSAGLEGVGTKKFQVYVDINLSSRQWTLNKF